MPACRSRTCWASRSPPAPHAHQQPTTEVHVFACLFERGVFSAQPPAQMSELCFSSRCGGQRWRKPNGEMGQRTPRAEASSGQEEGPEERRGKHWLSGGQQRGFDRAVLRWALTCGFALMSRVMTTSQVERRSFQEVGWIHGYVCWWIGGATAAPPDPGCNRLCLFLCLQTVGHLASRYGRSLWPVCFPLGLHPSIQCFR